VYEGMNENESLRVEGAGDTLDRPVVTLGAAGGEDDLVGLGVDALRDYAPGVFDGVAGLLGA